MFSAAVRVLVRAAAIQLEEAAARSTRPTAPSAARTPIHSARPDAAWRDKGKGKERDPNLLKDVTTPATQPVGNDALSRGTSISPEGLSPSSSRRSDQLGDNSLLQSAGLLEPGPSTQHALSNSHPSNTADWQPAVISTSAPQHPVLTETSGSLDPREDAGDAPAVTAEEGPFSTHATPPSLSKDAGNPPSSSGEGPQPSLSTVPRPASPSLTVDTPPSASGTLDKITQDTLIDTQSPGNNDEEEMEPILRASKVPSSRLGRLFHYGSLAASLSLGAAGESFRRSAGGGGKEGSVFMSDANVRRLVTALGRMRGAALKLGQFMSIQDNNILPPEIERVLHQVQAHADYMPDWQLEQVMSSELGPSWQSLFSSFSRVPIASASIGQVHRAVLASSGLPVAVKVQFPGIASSISSDLSNLSILLRGSAVLPRGLYLQNTIAVMRRELADECDYVREAEAGRRFSKELEKDDFFVVPKVVDEATTEKVLTTEWMSGKPLSRMKGMSQSVRDKIGTNILRLCLIELFQFRFMQTDPNWANFLYDAPADKVQLIDFGASREYTREFMDGWFRLLSAALSGDRESMKVESERLGYLTGEEGEEMVQAHLDSMALVASPFSYEGKYEFANQTITDSVRALIPIMLRQRLTPPPPETYSLNRKLSGAFLMCARLGAKVDCKKLWKDHAAGYRTVEMEQAEVPIKGVPRRDRDTAAV